MLPSPPTSPARERLGGGLVVALLALGAVAAWTTDRGRQRGLSDASTPAPVLDPVAERATFEVAPGFKVSLVASEPVVEAPIYSVFDQDGRLWVVEMPTYMRTVDGEGERAPSNRVVILDDKDGDGVFDKRTVFLDGLVLPRSVAPCYGGALVIEPPRLLFCKDNDGDGKADEKRVLADGFEGLESPEHAGNALTYGLDNWWHLSQHQEEFRFDGRGVQRRRTPAHGQWGLARDDLGGLYYTPNSNALLGDRFPKHYASRNPHLNDPTGTGASLTDDQSVQPAHATRGVNRGYLEGILRPDGRLANLTAACSPLIERSDGLGPDVRGDVFLCEAAGNLVKRMRFEPSGRVQNVYRETEFLRSTDERFRPVHLAPYPDGSLLLVDMHRGVIQHRVFVTPYLKGQIAERALQLPLDGGRLWRIEAEPLHGERVGPRFSEATDEELVAALSHPDGWWRDTAQRLLVERRATTVQDALRSMAESDGPAASRLGALWALEGLGALKAQDVLRAAHDGEATVRGAAARLGEGFAGDGIVEAAVISLAHDPVREVCVQAVLSMGSFESDAATVAIIERLWTSGGDALLITAALTGLNGKEVHALAAMPGARVDGDDRVMAALFRCVAASGPAERLAMVEWGAQLCEENDPRGGRLVGVIARELRLNTPSPRVLSLAAAPDGWLRASGNRAPLGAAMRAAADYFDWPNRPPVKRVYSVKPLTAEETALFERGRALFATCATCHGTDGDGNPGQAPALSGSTIVQGPPERMARVLLQGLEGPFVLRGSTYRGSMPPAPVGSDHDVAALMTFVRRSFGNTADAVSPQVVSGERSRTAGRKKAWTRDELLD